LLNKSLDEFSKLTAVIKNGVTGIKVIATGIKDLALGIS
jgi:hypothetical protein